MVMVRKATTFSPEKAPSRDKCEGCADFRGFHKIVGRNVENVL